MKRLALILPLAALIWGLLLTGCSSAPTVTSPGGTLSIGGEQPPGNVTWISPGKVTITNLYPGAQAEWTQTIHNGNDAVRSYRVTVRTPDSVSEGYEPLPSEYYDWITISAPHPSIAPQESLDVLVTVAMPKDVKYPGKHAEVWISVVEEGQEGFVQTELCSRWLISTK
jgi:hypothetical protein